MFYSDSIDGFDALGDTPSPPGAFYPNTISIDEVTLTNGIDGAVYTPTARQPGFVAGAAGPVNYVLISDAPEPSSLLLLGSGLVAAAGAVRLRLSI